MLRPMHFVIYLILSAFIAPSISVCLCSPIKEHMAHHNQKSVLKEKSDVRHNLHHTDCHESKSNHDKACPHRQSCDISLQKNYVHITFDKVRAGVDYVLIYIGRYYASMPANGKMPPLAFYHSRFSPLLFFLFQKLRL